MLVLDNKISSEDRQKVSISTNSYGHMALRLSCVMYANDDFESVEQEVEGPLDE